MKRVLATILVLNLSLPAFAKDKAVCEDLARFSRAPGVFTDGTGKDGKGTARNPQSMSDYVSALQTKYRSEIEQNFRTALTNPENIVFIKTVVNSFAYECDPQCLAMLEQKKLSGNVLENSTQALTSMLFEALLPSDVIGREQRMFRGGMDDRQFILKHPIFENERERVKKAIVASNHLHDSETFLRMVWERVKPIVAQVVQKRARDGEEKEFMLERLNQIAFKGTDCSEKFPEQMIRDTLVSDLFANAFYDRLSNSITYCKGMLILNQSEFSAVHTLAHEMAHSFGPCGASIGPGEYRLTYDHTDNVEEASKMFPFENVVECLRDVKSVGARRSEDKIGPQFEGRNQEGSDGRLFNSRSSRDNSREMKWSIFCSNDGITHIDQIDESFSDWVATEVIPIYMSKYHPGLTQENFIYGYSNVFRGANWANDGSPELDTHPDLKLRVNQLILANPKIREQMGCAPANKEKLIYCPDDFDLTKAESILDQNRTEPQNKTIGPMSPSPIPEKH